MRYVSLPATLHLTWYTVLLGSVDVCESFEWGVAIRWEDLRVRVKLISLLVGC